MLHPHPRIRSYIVKSSIMELIDDIIDDNLLCGRLGGYHTARFMGFIPTIKVVDKMSKPLIAL